MLGAIIRKLKTSLFVCRDRRWLYKGDTQTALFTLLPFYFFTFLRGDRYFRFERWTLVNLWELRMWWGCLRNQHALKAQKFIAWGNAPGIAHPHARRAVGAKVAKSQIRGIMLATTIM